MLAMEHLRRLTYYAIMTDTRSILAYGARRGWRSNAHYSMIGSRCSTQLICQGSSSRVTRMGSAVDARRTCSLSALILVRLTAVASVP